MAFTRVYLIPLIFSLLLPMTFFVTYMLAVSLDHVGAMFPYISDTGTFAPEMCLFGQSMNIMAILNLVFAWIRYSHVKLKCGTDLKFSFILCLNKLALWLAVLVSVGTSMVGNFQETGILVLHCIGALILFIPGFIYVWIQAIISIWTTGLISGRMIAMVRLVFGVLGVLLMAIEGISTPIAFYFFHGEDFRKWKPDDGGYTFHLMSVFSEWLLGLGYGVFVMTFIGEFQEIQIETPEVGIKTEKKSGSPKFVLLPGSDKMLQDTTDE